MREIQYKIDYFNRICSFCESAQKELIRLEKESMKDLCFKDEIINLIRARIEFQRKNEIDSCDNIKKYVFYKNAIKDQFKNWETKTFKDESIEPEEELEFILKIFKIYQKTFDRAKQEIINLIEQQLTITDLVDQHLMKTTAIAKKMVKKLQTNFKKMTLKPRKILL